MANATITGTASNFGSISGVLAGEAGTVAGTITGVVTGSLTGSVGVPGAGVPSDGLEGQILAKASDTSYDTEWIDNYATELRIVARNETGATLAKGTVVYINGAAGNKPTLAKALATGDATSAQTLGMVSADILHNKNGEVTVRGLLAGLDTSAYSAGTQLYLSGTTAGAVTSTKPSAPVHLVYVGIVSRQHANQGQVEVAVMNGFEIGELHDVKITSPSNGQVLKYDSAQGLWVNGTDSSGVAWGGITGTLSAQTDLQNALNAKLNASSPAAVGDLTITGAFTTLTASSALFKYTHSTNIEYCELTRDSFTLFADTSDKSVEITNAGIRLYDPAAGAAATITFPDNSVQSIAFPGFTGYATESYVTTALGSYAPLASPALTGTPTAPTAASNTNTTQLATTAFVLGQGNTTAATIVMNGTQAAGTSNLYARADHVHPTDTTLAPKASPALTGTPTAPTASAGTNTTQIATTAFVQQEVPAASTTAAGKVELATVAEARDGSSTSLVPTVEGVTWMLMNNSYRPYFNVTGGTSGTGASLNLVPPFRYEVAGPNTLTAGNAYVQTNNYHAMTMGVNSTVFDFSKKCWVSFVLDNGSATWVGDANNEIKAFWGFNTSNNGDDPTGMAIGVFKTGGTSSVWNLMVHDGTTLRKIASSTTMPTGQPQGFLIYSNGAGTVRLYINGTEVASSTNGPTGTRADTRFWNSVKQTASAATRIMSVLYYPKVYSLP